MGIKKLTKTVVDNLPKPEKGQVFYRDSKLTGFGVCIGRISKTYYAEKRINGRTVRTTIGKHGQIATDMARKKAQVLLAQMTEGQNPNLNKKNLRAKNISLKIAFDDFLLTRKNLKQRTVYDYRRVLNYYFSDWLNKSVESISKDMVTKRHSKIGADNGKAQANGAMRVLRAVLNFAAGQYENAKGEPILIENPVKALSKTRAWYRVDRRRTVVKPHELPAFFKALDEYKETAVTKKADTVHDYILLLLFTGLRRQEAAKLQWTQVDFKSRTFTVTDTKNNEPLTLPMSDFLFGLFNNRYENGTAEEFVFPGEGKGGYLVEPKRQLQRIRKLSGLYFTLHDLRRSFTSIAGNIIPAYALKALLNHKISGISADVTGGYFVQDAEALRPAMQKVTNQILNYANDEKGKVIDLATAKKV
ncbi:MAG: tyrosine-type recombinase/integrase [Nitrospinota bacterium]